MLELWEDCEFGEIFENLGISGSAFCVYQKISMGLYWRKKGSLCEYWRELVAQIG